MGLQINLNFLTYSTVRAHITYSTVRAHITYSTVRAHITYSTVRAHITCCRRGHVHVAMLLLHAGSDFDIQVGKLLLYNI